MCNMSINAYGGHYHLMKKLSLELLAGTIVTRRKMLKLTQAQLGKMAGINRSVLSNLESRQYTPSIDQLQALGEALDFDITNIDFAGYHISNELCFIFFKRFYFS